MNNFPPIALIDGPTDTCEISSRCTWNNNKPVPWCSLHEHEEACKYINPQYKLLGCYADEYECQKQMVLHQLRNSTTRHPFRTTTSIIPLRRTTTPPTKSVPAAPPAPAQPSSSNNKNTTDANSTTTNNNDKKSTSSKPVCSIM